MSEHNDHVTASWVRADRIRPFDIVETSRRNGHSRWVAELLFDVLGRRSLDAPDVALRPLLAAQAHRQRDHADAWRGRLAELEEFTPENATRSAGPAMDRLAAMLRGDLDTLELLVGVHRVVIPRLLAAYVYQRSRTSEITDGPTIRVLDQVIGDCRSDTIDGELMIQSLLRTDADVTRAAERMRTLEALVVEAGGVCGTGSIG
ncbi:MAG: hypothetical protein AB8G26_18535 [Ilumatobacter sp.]